MMNPLNRPLLFVLAYLKFIISTIHQHEQQRKNEKWSARNFGNSRHSHENRNGFFGGCGGRSSGGAWLKFLFKRRGQRFTFPDEELSGTGDSLHATVDDFLSSSSDSDGESNWRQDDALMMREIQEMLDMLNNNGECDNRT